MIFYSQLGLQLFTDVLSVYMLLKNYWCDNKACYSSYLAIYSLLIFQNFFVVLTDGLLIFAIWKIQKFIKLQANTETKKTQFIFAISIVCVAFLSSCLTNINIVLSILFKKNYWEKLTWQNKLDLWSEGSDHMAEFLFQITILGFCWIYATRPRTQAGKIENSDIEDE